LTETQIWYKKPLYLGETVRLEIWIAELRNASAWLEFRIYNDHGDLAASARQRGVFIDLATMRPQRIPQKQAALFVPFIGE
jgi:acyl-CoA thioester hydrolase